MFLPCIYSFEILNINSNNFRSVQTNIGIRENSVDPDQTAPEDLHCLSYGNRI